MSLMTTFEPRSPYSQEELASLYPKQLQLQLVQVTGRIATPPGNLPTSSRLQETAHNGTTSDGGVVSRRLAVTTIQYCRPDPTMNSMQSGRSTLPLAHPSPSSPLTASSLPGELTDKGRDTTLALGTRLRNLYVDQLKFMPSLISDSDMIYLRATPVARALESVQQSFWGMYPPTARTASFPPPTIIVRTAADETLYPNEGSCRRFAQLSSAFAQRTAERWNETDEMAYLNTLISKWMPESSKRVAVDSHPRLSGIMDTVNATLAHGPATRLPAEFYDPKGRAIIDQIGTEEWFSGYAESREYRTLGVGALVGDVVSRMVGSAERGGIDRLTKIDGESKEGGRGGAGTKEIKFAMSGCHDTTLAGFLCSLGAFNGEHWPPYTSHIAIELFRQKNTPPSLTATDSRLGAAAKNQSQGWWAALFGAAKPAAPTSGGIGRRTVGELSSEERSNLDGYFVRLRYNDRVMTVPGCKQSGKHLEGDKSFCTLEAFKAIADTFTPKNWKKQCAANLDESAFPAAVEPAGVL
ncbi:hypothetical protein LTR28_003903 [Elasticomyces elasticus]|nr:hypothetical protein LTR28_003903 [Elasticomyces elasticus]